MESTEHKIALRGRSLITNLFVLLRAAKIYDAANATILNVAGRLASDIGQLVEEAGEISLRVIEGSFYIEGARIKTSVSDVENFTAMAEECEKRGIGAFDFISPVTTDDLIRLVYAMKSRNDAQAVQTELEHQTTRNIIIGGPVVLQREEGLNLKDNFAVARRAYIKTLAGVGEMDAAVKSGGRLKLKKIKRALQLVVDSILADESFLLQFTRPLNTDNYFYYHTVNVSVLSVALGKRLGIGRVDLRNLALTAFFHDAGKLEIPLSIINKKAEYTPKEEELLKRHPEDGIRLLMRFFGLNETSILSMLVSFEHHMKPDFSGYPERSAERKLNLFSRIVGIADEYDSLVSGKVYSRKKLEPNEALAHMTAGSGTKFDPILLKTFTDMFV